MRPRKRFGQHFLTDVSVLHNMAAAISLKPDDRVLEIGPGQGALTDELMPVVAAQGHYTAVEIDRDLIPWLQARYANLQLINADMLKVDLSELLSTQDQNWRVVGNLPYNVASGIIMNLVHYCIAAPGVVTDMHFMVQKEMGDRLAADPGSKAWGRLSVMVQFACSVEHLFVVPPESFAPPPKVDSSVIRIQPRPEMPSPELLAQIDGVARLAFAQRRKRLSNALKSLNINWDDCAVGPQLRADDVAVADFVELARCVGD